MEGLTMLEVVKRGQCSLDELNLKVAEFRVKKGMSKSLIHLYGAMGRLSAKLMALEAEIVKIESGWEEAVTMFHSIKSKES